MKADGTFSLSVLMRSNFYFVRLNILIIMSYILINMPVAFN